MEKDTGRPASTDQTPTPTDDLEEAEEKSRSVDERIPEALDPHEGTTTEVLGAPAGYLPQAGMEPTGGPVDDPGALGPGERALEQERKATRAKIQPG